MESTKDTFRTNLTRLIKEKGCTQTELADFVGVSKATLSMWLSGKMSPRMDKIDTLFTKITRRK